MISRREFRLKSSRPLKRDVQLQLYLIELRRQIGQLVVRVFALGLVNLDQSLFFGHIFIT